MLSRQNALDTYGSILFRLKSQYDKKYFNKEALQEASKINMQWLHTIYNTDNTWHKNFEENKYERYDINLILDNSDCNYLYSFKYRNIEVHVFNDDYGQQEYAWYWFNNEWNKIAGGAYNYFAYEVFMSEIDYAIEDAFLNDKITGDELWATMTL